MGVIQSPKEPEAFMSVNWLENRYKNGWNNVKSEL